MATIIATDEPGDNSMDGLEPKAGTEMAGDDLIEAAVDAACRANIHPQTDPSDVERRKMRRSIEAAMPHLARMSPVPIAAPGELVERVARAICKTQGEDPDALSASRYCDASNQPMPLWNWYAEQAEAAISVLSPAPITDAVAMQWRKRERTFPAAEEPWSYVDYHTGLKIAQHPEKYETRALGVIAAPAHPLPQGEVEPTSDALTVVEAIERLKARLADAEYVYDLATNRAKAAERRVAALEGALGAAEAQTRAKDAEWGKSVVRWQDAFEASETRAIAKDEALALTAGALLAYANRFPLTTPFRFAGTLERLGDVSLETILDKANAALDDAALAPVTTPPAETEEPTNG